MTIALPENRFKEAISSGLPQIGLWSTLGSNVCAELCAAADFDWMLVDAEHGCNDVLSVLPQLQAIAAYRTAAVVRIPSHDPASIKRYLDIGAQSLMIPMVETAEQAEALARAAAFAPEGVRGLAAMTRAARWSRVPDYVAAARSQICLIAQIESARGVANVDAICAVDGIDAVLVGPADMAATMGFRGQPAHPDVIAATWHCLDRVTAAGKPAGIFVLNEDFARECIGRGFSFVSVGADGILLSRAVDALRDRFRQLPGDGEPS